MLDIAINEGIIQKKGGWYAIDGKNVAQGLVNLKAYLDENKDVYEDIKQKVKEAVKPETDETTDTSIEADNMTDDEIANEIEETETGEV